MIKRLQSLISAGLFKTGLVSSMVLASVISGFGQNLLPGASVEHQLFTAEAGQSFKTGFRYVTKQFAGGSNARIAAVKSFPLNSQMYSPNGATSWNLRENGTYTYDSQGNQTSLTRIPVVSQYPSLKDSALYDGHGNQTFVAGYTRNGSSNTWNLNNASRSQYTYNPAGQPLEIITEDKNLTSWTNSSRETYVYNPAGFVTEFTAYQWLNNSWVPMQKFIYGFAVATNPPNSMTIQTYNGGVWENQTRYQNITWHNFNQGEYLNREEQTWNMNSWVNQSKEIVVYDQLGGSVNVSQFWNGLAWENAGRSYITLNTHSDITTLKRDTWQNNTWVPVQERQFLLTYNSASQLIETISREWNSMTNIMQNSGKTTYSNFQVLGTTKALPALTVQVYPNPTTDLLQISAQETSNMQATLTDLTGKLVLSQNLPATSKRQLNLSALAKGTYLLRLETQKCTSVQKIIKQ